MRKKAGKIHENLFGAMIDIVHADAHAFFGVVDGCFDRCFGLRDNILTTFHGPVGVRSNPNSLKVTYAWISANVASPPSKTDFMSDGMAGFVLETSAMSPLGN